MKFSVDIENGKRVISISGKLETLPDAIDMINLLIDTVKAAYKTDIVFDSDDEDNPDA